MLFLFLFSFFAKSDLSQFKGKEGNGKSQFDSPDNILIIVLLIITIFVVVISASICFYVWLSTKNSHGIETQQRLLPNDSSRFMRQENKFLPQNYPMFSPVQYPSGYYAPQPQHGGPSMHPQFMPHPQQMMNPQPNWQFPMAPPQQQPQQNQEQESSEEDEEDESSQANE